MKILYIAPNLSTFVQHDINLLSKKYEVKSFSLNQGDKKKLPFQLMKQFFQMLWNVPSSNIVICHFAGYSSYLPFLIAKLFRKPRLLIIAGTDAASFPEMNYGSFNRNKLLEKFTRKSYALASHILPVHESLAFQEYDYHEFGAPAQGFHRFVPASKNIPFSPLYYSFDQNLFFDKGYDRQEKSFISVGNLQVATTYKRKGFDLIIELAKARPDFHFTLIGWDGKTKLDYPSNVRILPFMPQDQIVDELNKHQFYFQLSLMEGFPNALGESMLCGCVPIGSNVSGIPFIIGETGYVLKKHDLNALLPLVDQAVNSGRIEELSAAAIDRVKTKFNDENKLKAFDEVFAKYLTK